MSLKYALAKNLLTSRTNDYTAQTQNVKSHDTESVIQKMLKKGTTITRTDTLAVLNSFFEVIEEITKEGETINTDIINTNFSRQGVFEGATDTFNPKRHAIKLNINVGKELKRVIDNIHLEKTTTTEALPYILEVKDSITASVDEKITSNGVVRIIGNMLKVQGDDPANGVFFVEDNGTQHKAATLVENNPRKLIVIAPPLEAGQYSLQVATQYSSGKMLKSPKTGVFNKTLTVL